MSRCFSFSSLSMALILMAVPFAAVPAKTAALAKTTVKTKANVSKTAAKPVVAAKSSSAEKKAAAAKNSVASAKNKTVTPAKQNNTTKTGTVTKASNQKNASKTGNTKSAAKATSAASHKKIAKKQTTSSQKTMPMRVTTLKAGGKSIKVEVASTEAEHERGLMYRKSLPADSGMLFDFKGPAKTCMWMKDTYIPLAVAFIDVNGKVVNIEEMKPRTTTSHCSKNWIRYALEMNTKWFSRHGVKPGSRITGLPH